MKSLSENLISIPTKSRRWILVGQQKDILYKTWANMSIYK